MFRIAYPNKYQYNITTTGATNVRTKRNKCQREKERRLDEFKMASNDGLDVHDCVYYRLCSIPSSLEHGTSNTRRQRDQPMESNYPSRSWLVPLGHGCCARYCCIWSNTRKNGRRQQWRIEPTRWIWIHGRWLWCIAWRVWCRPCQQQLWINSNGWQQYEHIRISCTQLQFCTQQLRWNQCW